MDRTSPVLLCIGTDRTGLLIRKAVLESMRYTTITAPDAVFALAIVRAIRIDLLITEQSLPSMTGAELARLCKTMRPQMRALLLTCSPSYPTPHQVDGQVSKLDGPVALLDKIHELLAVRKQASATSLFAAA